MNRTVFLCLSLLTAAPAFLRPRSLIVLLGLFFLSRTLKAADQYAVDWFKIAGGGAMFSSAGNYEVSGTIGQPNAGVLTNATVVVAGGFWAFQFEPPLPGGFEADVSPRPSGNNNGNVSIADWVQVGRFAASLDPLPPGIEFQKADCAPRATSGGGTISIADWVQAGRYAAGLDSVQSAGGPSASPAPLFAGGASAIQPASTVPAPRRLVVSDVRVQAGQTGEALVELEAFGDENAIGFSLQFDAKILTLGEVMGEGAETLVIVNKNFAASGRVGVAVARPAGVAFSPGRSRLARLTFAAHDSATQTSLMIGNSPISLAAVSVEAFPLPVAWTSGTVTVSGTEKPQLTVERSDGSELVVSWEAVPGRTYRLLSKGNLNEPEWRMERELTTSGNAGSVRIPWRGEAQRYFILHAN